MCPTTVVFGIDGGEWNVVQPLLDSGALPNLAQLINSGARADFQSTTPPVSPPAWTSIQTGTNPGKHGIYDFQYPSGNYSFKGVNASHVQSTPFWTVLNDHGTSTGLFKLPITYPPDKIDGFVVSGFPTPNGAEDYVTPSSIRDTVGPVTELFESPAVKNDQGLKAFYQNVFQVTDNQTEAVLDLIEETDTDVLVNVYDGPDRIQHYYWKYYDPDHERYEPESEFADIIPNLYQKIDKHIGRILSAIEGDINVLVISDHGFEALEKDIYIEEWLSDQGYLVEQGDQTEIERTTATVLDKTWELLRQTGLAHRVRSIVPEGLLQRAGSFKNAQTEFQPDYDRTSVFFSGLSGQALYVNLEGRFEDGIVSKSESESLINEVINKLEGLNDPETGESVVDAAYSRDEVYEGWAAESAPDIVVETSPGYTLVDGQSETLVDTPIQGRTERSGDHRSTGLFVGSGPAFADADVGTLGVGDFAPTLLYLEGCPIPEGMDGTVATGAFKEHIVSNRVPERTTEYSHQRKERSKNVTDEDGSVEERLENLGYL